MPTKLSGTLRFSVESLLYYAPQINSVGQQLASAEATAQRQLLGLGAFWGGSWPDQAFANAYQPAQYAALIMVGRLAEQVQAIAGGVELMAHNYGVTEDANTQDVERIAATEGVINKELNLSGGVGSPPTTTLRLPTLGVTGPHPTPEPNPPPVPPGSGPTPSPSASAFLSASPSPSPTGPVVPHPEPGPSPRPWQMKSTTSFFGPWPSGDPNRMDEAAGYWGTLIGELDEAWTNLRRITDYILADAEGNAANAFYDYTDGLTNPANGSLTRAIEVCQYLQQTCTTEATNIRAIKKQLELGFAELGVAIIVGEIVSTITIGTAEVLAVAVDAGLLDWLTDTVTSFAIDAAVLAKDLDEAGDIIVRVVASITNVLNDTVAPFVSNLAGTAVASGFQGAAISIQTLVIDNALAQAFGQQPTEGAAALKDILNGTWQGALTGSYNRGGVLNETAGTLSENIIKLGEESDSQALLALGRQLKSGSITVAAANQALVRLIDPASLNPVQAISNAISNRLGTAIGPNPGSHAATEYPGPRA